MGTAEEEGRRLKTIRVYLTGKVTEACLSIASLADNVNGWVKETLD